MRRYDHLSVLKPPYCLYGIIILSLHCHPHPFPHSFPEGPNMLLMNISSHKSLRVYFPILIAAGLLLTSFVIYLCVRDSQESPKEKILGYTRDFYDKYSEKGGMADSTQSKILAEATANIDNDSLFFSEMKKFSRRMFQKGDQVIAFDYLKQIMAILEAESSHNNDLLRFKAYCYLLLGAATDEVGLTSLSQGYYFSGMNVADKVENSTIRDDFHNNLGVSMFRSGNTEKAESFFNKALEGVRTHNNKDLSNIIYNNMAAVNSEKGDFGKAIDYMLKAIQSVNSTTQKAEYYSLQTALGDLYLKNGELPMAYACLSNAFRNLDPVENKTYLYDASLLLADYFFQTAKDDSVRKYMEVARGLADLTNNPGHKLTLYDKEAEIASSQGNFKEAFAIAAESRRLKDSLYNAENSQRIERANNIYEIEKKAYEEKSGIATWNPVVVFTTMSLIVLLLVAVTVWIILMKRKNDRINTEKARTASELAEMRERQLAEERKIKEEKDEELRLFNQKLTSFTLERIKNNERIGEISTEAKRALINVGPRDKEQQALLKEIISKLEVLQSDTRWEEFQYYFEKVHPDFYTRLDAAHPDLTAKDRRLCALLSLGLSTKDIGLVTNLEVRSVESSRNRLRKKLGLENDRNLFDYIRTFS